MKSMYGLGPLACSNSELTSVTLDPFRHLWGLLWRVIGSLPGIYLHRRTQHRETSTYLHASSGIRTYDTSVQTVPKHKHLRPRGHLDRRRVVSVWTFTRLLYQFISGTTKYWL